MDDLALITDHDDPTPALVICSRYTRPTDPYAFGDVIGIFVDSGEIAFGAWGDKLFWANAATLRPSEARTILGYYDEEIVDPETKEVTKVPCPRPGYSAITTNGIDAATVAALRRVETYLNVSVTRGGPREGKVRTMKGSFVDGSRRKVR